MSYNSGNAGGGSAGRFFIGITIALLFLALLVTGCTSQKTAGDNVVRFNDTVKVHYTESLASNGKVIDSSVNGSPIEFVAGSGMVIPGLDNAIIGMSIGENKTVTIPADQAYGLKRNDLVITTPKTAALANYTPNKDTVTYITVPMPDGSIQHFPIIASNETTVTVDMNHPLAGQDLIFTIQLIDIVKK
jgi:FKBP-type peptidyl-prolyl cis-trans isomerase 2